MICPNEPLPIARNLRESGPHASHTAKWRRCVDKLEDKGDVESPHAVCTAQMGEESFAGKSREADPGLVGGLLGKSAAPGAEGSDPWSRPAAMRQRREERKAGLPGTHWTAPATPPAPVPSPPVPSPPKPPTPPDVAREGSAFSSALGALLGKKARAQERPKPMEPPPSAKPVPALSAPSVLIARDFRDKQKEAGTSEGAVKGWESRKGGPSEGKFRQETFEDAFPSSRTQATGKPMTDKDIDTQKQRWAARRDIREACRLRAACTECHEAEACREANAGSSLGQVQRAGVGLAAERRNAGMTGRSHSGLSMYESGDGI